MNFKLNHCQSPFASKLNCSSAFLLVIFFLFVDAQICIAQQEIPFDVFGESVDNREIYLHIEKQGLSLIADQPEDALANLQTQLEHGGSVSNVTRESLSHSGIPDKANLYQHMVKSSVYLSELYDCGRCDRTHAGCSGGVVISEDGLVLTNYHVLEDRKTGNREAFIAMTYDGKCYGIEEVLAADEQADIALVRLKSNGDKFHAAPIAEVRPNPTDTVRIVSNPSGEFFVLTTGEVSRYAVSSTRAKTASNPVVWMETTADFAGGSSGSGVFNSKGEVVGIASRVHPLMRNGKLRKSQVKEGTSSKMNTYVEMIIKRCVALKSIHGCFSNEEDFD